MRFIPNFRSRRTQIVSVFIAVVVMGAVLISNALAVHDEAFQLDGNVAAGPATSYNNNSQLYDWTTFFNSSGASIFTFPDASAPTGFTASGFDRDFVTATNGNYLTSDTTTYTQGSKDIDNISSWVCTAANNVTDKGDIQNSYAVGYTDPITKDEFLYFGMERNSNNGDANVAFWFLQSSNANCNATAKSSPNWTGDHVDGDLFVVSAFTNGGAVSTINAYRWTGGAGGSLGTTPVASGGDCTATNPAAPVNDAACATANKASVTDIPWLTNNNGKSTGTGHTLLTAELFEGGVNLTDSGLGDKCFNTFVGDTRSSQSFTATLYDFARGSLGGCDSTTTTTPTPAAASTNEIPANARVSSHDSAHVVANGVSHFSGTVKFSLCGPLALTSTANCQTGGVEISTTTLTDVTSPQDVTSDSVTLTEAGKYCWRAVYSGDTTRGVPSSTDPANSTSQTECFKITPRTPTVPTCSGTYSAAPVTCTPDGTVDFGNAVIDRASLTGTANQKATGGLGDGSIIPTAGGTAGNGAAHGSITFKLYGPGTTTTACATLATGFPAAGITVDISPPGGDGVYGGPPTVSFTPQAPGVYHWKASYSGDSPNTNSVSENNSACTDANEDVTVRQIPTDVKTKQSWFPNDSATITSTLTGDNLGAGGTVDFTLYPSDDCTGSALYTERQTLTGGSHSEDVATHNYTGSTAKKADNTTVSPYRESTDFTDAAGSIVGPNSWKVAYTPASADTAHLGVSSSCTAGHTEKHSITYTNDAGGH